MQSIAILYIPAALISLTMNFWSCFPVLFIILFCESALINETRFPLPLLDFFPFVFPIGFFFLFNLEFVTTRIWLLSGASYFARRFTTLRKFPAHVSSNTSSSAKKDGSSTSRCPLNAMPCWAKHNVMSISRFITSLFFLTFCFLAVSV